MGLRGYQTNLVRMSSTSSNIFQVLADPGRRAVYDSLGEEGLKTVWTVSKRIKSPDEVSYH